MCSLHKINCVGVSSNAHFLLVDKLCQFILDGSAKTLAVKVIAEAKDYNPDAKTNELHKQNEQEIQKQQEAPIV